MAYLDSVNDREASRYGHEESPPGVAGRPARLGSGEVRVERVELLDEGGQTAAFVVTGRPMRIRLHYRAQEPVGKAVFGIGFVHESGVFTAGPNSGRVGGWDLEPGLGSVDLDVPELTLLPGTFSISSAIIDRGHTYDFAENQATLKVRSSGDDEPGLVHLDGSWSITPAPPSATGSAGSRPERAMETEC